MRRGRAYRPEAARTVAALIAPLCLLLATSIVPVFAGGVSEKDDLERRREILQSELSLAEMTYPVVLAAVVAPDATDVDRVALGSWIEVVRDIVAEVETRYLPAEERVALAQLEIETYQLDLTQREEERIRALERARLEGRSAAPGRGEAVRETDDQLAQIADDRSLVASFPLDGVAVPPEAPIELIEGDYRFRRVLPSPEGISRERPDARMIVYLTVDAVGDRLLVTGRSFVPHLREDREIFRVVGQEQEIPAELELQERRLVAALSGRPLGIVRLRAVDSRNEPLREARIFLGGEYLGVSPVRAEYVLPGTYEVRVELPDGRSAVRSITVYADAEREEVVTISAAAPETILLTTVPSGARVYRGAQWVGFSPVLVPRPLASTSYTLSAEGYLDSRVTVGPDTPRRVARTLVGSDYDWSAAVEDSRDRFYRSFGLFALSVAVPILVNGTYQTYTGLVDAEGALSDELTSAEQRRIIQQTNALYYGYYAGIGLSAGLFGNMIWRLVNYVRTAQGYHIR
jgi:hypothetical protein